MSTPANDPKLARALIHAPFGRDGALICSVLQRAGIHASASPTVKSLCSSMDDDVGAILVGEEALSTEAVDSLQDVLKLQSSWSDLPVFVMTGSGKVKHNRSRLEHLHALGNVSLLERPLRLETVVTAFRMALRAREHQYQIRGHLEKETRAAEELALSNAELRRVNEDLNQFAYSASHDLQEPLRMVAIYSQMLQRKYGNTLDAQASEYLNFAVQGAQRMEMLLKDLLAYTQVANTIENHITEPVNASQPLEQALENLQGAIEESGALVETQPLPTLLVKDIHLLQLFQNLIGNALKYRGEAQPHIVVSAERANGMWRFYVRDNGIGINPKYAEQVFGLFKRLHNEREKYDGTGIGLAICQKIVERYGGRIWVESAGMGHGSTFYFTLPAGEKRFKRR